MTKSTIQKRLDNFKNHTLDEYLANAVRKQENIKVAPVVQELYRGLNLYIDFTSSPEAFKNALNEKKLDIKQFNQNIILFALTLKHIEKIAEKDEEVKKSLPSLQEKMNTINENIVKIAPKLGYTVSYYSLDKLEGKNFKEVKEILKNDFGTEPNFEAIFSAEILNKISDLFAFIGGLYTQNNLSVPILSDKNEQEEKKESNKTNVKIMQEPQKTENSVPNKKEQKQTNGNASNALRSYGKKIFIAGLVSELVGGLLVVGGFYYLPILGFGLAGLGLVALGSMAVFVGGVSWIAGLIGDAIHNRNEKKKEEQEKKASIKPLERDKKDISDLKQILEKKDRKARKEALPIFEYAFKQPDPAIRKEAMFYFEKALFTLDEPEDILDLYKVALKSPYKDVKSKANSLIKKVLSNGKQ